MRNECIYVYVYINRLFRLYISNVNVFFNLLFYLVCFIQNKML